jgi:hypothetical protein
MSKAEKLLAQMKHNPRDWRIAQLQTVARHYGVTESRPASGSSHVTFRSSNGTKITVPDHRPIKPVYITLFVALIEEIQNHE